jgi:integrative and conjugative element protein (TIGR02256 family)
VVAPVAPYHIEIVARGAAQSSLPHVIDADARWPEWAATFRPYVEARKLASIDAMLKRLGFRNPVDAPASGSIARLLRSPRRRCDVYVLHFANGEYYVGQTVDITRRFVQHRKRHRDIAETGGILIGRIEGDRVIVAHAVGPGPNAIHEPAKFLRDGDYAQQQLDEYVTMSEAIDDYIGEWHSHPLPVGPSMRDRESMSWISTRPAYNQVESEGQEVKRVPIQGTGRGRIAFAQFVEVLCSEARTGRMPLQPRPQQLPLPSEEGKHFTAPPQAEPR